MIERNTAGHRKRLRDRFLVSGLNGFLDYEVIELLLTLGITRRDCKPMAKEAIKKFGNLQKVLDASPEELKQINGIGEAGAFSILLFHEIAKRYTKEKITHKIQLTSPRLIADYMKEKIGRESKEYLYVLLLDSRSHLIKDVNISVGTVDFGVVHPREIFKEAIKYSASNIILAHNHPSNEPEASPEDIAITRRLQEVSKIFGIELLDHVIVTKNSFYSLKEKGLI